MMPLEERRLRAEWQLLLDLAAVNPGRLMDLRAEDTTFYGALGGVRAQVALSHVGSGAADAPEWLTHHPFRLHYPVHFPAVPMELYLQTPVLHPNVHPETGFVCVWERHRADNTVELALHKLAAMLAGRLHNADAPHVMQPEALGRMNADGQPGALLTGVRHTAADALPCPARGRRRLS